ncbi:MAG: hypothetical protein PHG85_06360 [Candidatus Altiarchaeota archaeon]|nr:hypothetical protein [Candidatus Altiarchaeota archaeon]
MPQPSYTKLAALIAVIVLSSGCTDLVALFIDLGELEVALFNLATALGALMLAIHGLRWLTSDTPETRDDAKKAITYIIMALILATVANQIVNAMYGFA